MTEYKKTPPIHHPHYGKTHSGKIQIPMTIEYYLANIISEIQGIKDDLKTIPMEKLPDGLIYTEDYLDTILHQILKVWDLIPNEEER